MFDYFEKSITNKVLVTGIVGLGGGSWNPEPWSLPRTHFIASCHKVQVWFLFKEENTP